MGAEAVLLYLETKQRLMTINPFLVTLLTKGVHIDAIFITIKEAKRGGFMDDVLLWLLAAVSLLAAVLFVCCIHLRKRVRDLEATDIHIETNRGDGSK